MKAAAEASIPASVEEETATFEGKGWIMAGQSTPIALFKGKEIRKMIHNNEWWFSISDVVEALTDSRDVRQYMKRIRSRDSELNSYWGTICTPLEMTAKDGKKRQIDSANTEGMFRIIQSIPSPKARPFNRWLAKVGYDRTPQPGQIC